MDWSLNSLYFLGPSISKLGHIQLFAPAHNQWGARPVKEEDKDKGRNKEVDGGRSCGQTELKTWWSSDEGTNEKRGRTSEKSLEFLLVWLQWRECRGHGDWSPRHHPSLPLPLPLQEIGKLIVEISLFLCYFSSRAVSPSSFTIQIYKFFTVIAIAHHLLLFAKLFLVKTYLISLPMHLRKPNVVSDKAVDSLLSILFILISFLNFISLC